MILSGKEIQRRVEDGRLVIDPFDPLQLNPNSYNLRLHDELQEVTDLVLSMNKPTNLVPLKIPADGLMLLPNRLYLGRTVERTETPDLVPCLEGRSSIGRLGIQVHITAGFGDVGFAGSWTLEITCVLPVRIFPFVPICQIGYSTILGEYDSYAQTGKYNNDGAVMPSQLYTEFEGNTYGKRRYDKKDGGSRADKHAPSPHSQG